MKRATTSKVRLAPQPQRRGSGIAAVAGLLLAALAAAFAVSKQAPPRALGDDAPATEFSAGRAMRHLEVIAAGPRPIGSAANREAREYVRRQLEALGLATEIQRTTVVQGWRVVDVENLVARLGGSAPSRAILLVAHLDSVPMGPGAGDAGAAVATILETVRAIRAGPPLANDLMVLFTNPEEIYLHGARAFVDEHPWLEEVGMVVNMDPGGVSGPALVHETGADNRWWIGQLAAAAPHPFGSSMAFAVKRLQGDRSDEFHLFAERKIPGFNISFIEGDTHYHSPLDRPENVDPRSLQHLGSYALSITRHFGGMRLPPPPVRGDAVFFNAVGDRFVHYPESWRFALALLVTALFAAVLGFGGAEGRPSPGAMLRGAGLWLLAAGASVLAVWAAKWLVTRTEAVATVFLTGDVYYGERYLLGFVALAAAAAAACYAAARRRVALHDAAFGALLVLWLMMVAATVALPGGTQIGTWTLPCLLTGWLVVRLAGAGWTLRAWHHLLLAAAAVPAILLIAPAVPLVFGALSFDEAPFLMPLVALIVGLLLPAVYRVQERRPWILPSLAAFAGAGLLGWAIAGPLDWAHPRTDFLVYGLDATEGRALWASRSRARRPVLPDEWTRQFFTAESELGRVPELYPWSSTVFLRGPAPLLPLPPPTAELLQEMEAGESRTLRLRIRSQRRAPILTVVVEQGVESWSTGGRGIPGNQVFLYYNFPDEGFELTLTLGLEQPLELALIDATYGLPTLHDADYRPRPPDHMPEPTGGPLFTDTTLVRTDLVF